MSVTIPTVNPIDPITSSDLMTAVDKLKQSRYNEPPIGQQLTPAEWSEKLKWKIPATSKGSDPQSVPDALTLAIDFKKFQEEYMGRFDNQIPDPPNYKTIPSKKGSPMELFKFATTKPSAEVIWNTLLKADIKHAEGTSLDHFRFAMYCILQLEPDFKKAKKTALGTSRVYDAATLLGITKDQFLSINTNIPTHYPSWVYLSLYHPYYMAKQLFHLHVSYDIAMKQLFDRTETSEQEFAHLIADQVASYSQDYSGLTAWMLDNVSVDFYFQHVVEFSKSVEPTVVTSKEDIISHLVQELETFIPACYNSMLPVGIHILIPQFILKETYEA
jgi:hypothetical protein